MLLHHRRRRARAKSKSEGGAKQGIVCSRAPHTRRPRVSSAEVLRQAPNLDVLRRTASQLTCTDHPPSHTWPSLTAQLPSSLSLLSCLADPHTPPPWCRGPNLVLCASSVYVRTSCLVFGLLSNAPSAHARLFSDCIALHGPSLAVSGRPPTRRRGGPAAQVSCSVCHPYVSGRAAVCVGCSRTPLLLMPGSSLTAISLTGPLLPCLADRPHAAVVAPRPRSRAQ